MRPLHTLVVGNHGDELGLRMWSPRLRLSRCTDGVEQLPTRQYLDQDTLRTPPIYSCQSSPRFLARLSPVLEDRDDYNSQGLDGFELGLRTE